MSTTALPILTNHRAQSIEPAAAPSIIDLLLMAQQELSAVERFSENHDRSAARSGRYSELIPLSAPGKNEQYAFEVDLDACSGCKACVTACHTVNGLDPHETWRDVGMLVGDDDEHPILQHITSSCHHCLDPACMEGCPVIAYEKDPLTGIVRHLDDRCIGCQYCIFKCPYDAPKYNARLGIVRKCDMCSSRLSAGEAPACAEGCPNQAIRIRIVGNQRVADECEADVFLPGAPNPSYTLPTTIYKTARPMPRNTRPADHYSASPQLAHMPLVVMLVLTQLSVGAFTVAQALAWVMDATSLRALRPLHAAAALSLGLLALGASVLHLGRPLRAFRSFAGLRTSWLSREIVAFGLYAGLASIYAVCVWFAPNWFSSEALNIVGTAVAGTGLLAVFCSVMVYHDTRRVFWSGRYTATKFFTTTLLLGVATTLLAALLTAATTRHLYLEQVVRGWGRTACLVMAAGSVLKITFGLLTFRYLLDRTLTPMKRTAQLLIGPLSSATNWRLVLGIVGGILLPLLTFSALGDGKGHAGTKAAIMIAAAFALTLIAELLERYLFFRAVIAPKMPGGTGGGRP